MATFGTPIVASPNLLPSTAEVFNASKSGGYGAGEYVYHEGKLYKFTAAHTGAWTGTDVEAVKLADEVAELKSEIDQIDPKIEAGFPQKSASGSIVTIEDGADNVPVVSLTAEINPVQDLHGYESPWPAGGGINKLPNPEAQTITSNGVTCTVDANGVYTFSGTADPSFFLGDFPVAPYTIQSGDSIHLLNNATLSNMSFSLYFTDESHWEVTPSSLNRILTYGDDVVGKTITSVRFFIAAGYSYSGKFSPMILQTSSVTPFTPYENICPISGYDKADVSVQGNSINIWNERWEQGDINRTTGQDAPTTHQIRSVGYTPVVAGRAYMVVIGSDAPAGSSIAVLFYAEDKSFIASYWEVDGTTMWAPANAAYIRFTTNSNYGGTYLNNISINYPSTDTAYHPYVGSVTPITFPDEAGTVYGGVVDPINGGLTVNKKSQTFVGASGESWSYTPNYSALVDMASISISDALTGGGNQEIISNLLTFTTGDSTPWAGKTNNNGVLLVYLPVGSFADAAAWKAFLASNNLQIVYNITPVVYEVDPAVIKTLYLLNNIWADTGDISLVYRADPATYTAEQIRIMLNAMVAPVEASTTASKAYSVNDFLIMNNVLYKVISPISNGGTITINTNVSATTIGEQITAILNS